MSTQQMFHYSFIIIGEFVAAAFLAVVMFAMIIYREHRKSSRFLFFAFVAEFLFLLGDGLSYYNLIVAPLPIWLMHITYFLSYVCGLIVLIPFSLYSAAFIREKTTVSKWVYQIPVFLSLVSVGIAIGSIIFGNVYGVVDGKMTEINGLTPVTGYIQIAVAVYLPIVAFFKRKAIGMKAVMLLGLFGIVPVVLFFVAYNFAGLATALALVIVYILLQCDISAEKEKRRKELVVLNGQLEETNKQKIEQLEEITALNSQLEEDQSRLEEAASEQEAQLEEITALNSELEANQVKLEEFAAEQEAQLKEVAALNDELNKARAYAESANSAKTAFLFNMSHDIRTPMNAIIGFRDLLEKHQDDPEKRADYLKKIEDSSNVLLSIINNVLEMARIEKGMVEIEESAGGVDQFNDALYSIFQEMMVQKGITFTSKIDVQHPYVYWDPVKLREVFINILSNAYKYTNKGGSVTMVMEEVPSDRDGYALYRTTITDTGIGMSEDFLPHIFEEFSRENTTTDNKIEGTGLGMPIVKRLVEIMEGTIEVRSKKGVGTTFIVTIPHRIADKSNLGDHDPVQIDPALFKGKRILLAEDNELNAEIAIEILSEAGFIVDRAENGVVCCEKLLAASDGYYDLILMDIQMPKMNGYEATKAIRKMENASKANMPILAMTANAFEEDKREALRAGMNGHLAKPINVAELMKTLAETLS